MEVIASDLKDVLDRLSNILTNKGIVEDANKFVFNNETIHVFDGETFIRANFKTDVSGAVEGQSFLKYIDKLGTAKITIAKDEGKINIKKGRSVASFVVEEDVSMPVEPDELPWKKAPGNLIQALTTCSYTCGQDYTDMRSVVIHVAGDFAESTDEERITRYKLNRSIKSEFFVPADIVPFLAKAKVVQYAKTDDWMFFENQNGDLICHRNITFGEPYEDLEKVVNECNEGNPIELPDKMYDAVEKAAIFQSDLKVESDRRVTIRCKGGKIRVESRGTHGNFLEILPCAIEGSFSFLINPAFLMQIMEKSNSIFFHQDYIRIQTEDHVFLTSLAAEQ